MPAFPFDLRLKQSATFAPRFKIGGCNSTVSLANYRARTMIRRSIDDDEMLLEMTTENGGHVLDAEARILSFVITDEERDTLIALDETRLVYDTFLISPTNRSDDFMAGNLVVERSVTHD